MIRRFRITLPVLGVTLLMSCGDSLSSDGGGLAITAEFSESAANASFDAARIRIIGPTNRTVNTTPGAEEVIEGLAPGQYRVVLEGLEGNNVELFGQQSNVTVSSGNTTDVTVTFSAFVPALNALPATTPTLRFDVMYGAVPGAAGYRVEWDTDGSFANPNLIALATTTAEVPGPPGDVYVRVRAATEFATFSAPSNVQRTDVDPVVASVAVSPADLDTLIGQGDTVQYSATTMDANGDEFPGPGFSWLTSDAGVATIDGEAHLIAQSNGTIDVIATADGIDGQTSFTSATMQADSGLFFPYDIAFRPMSLAFDGSQYWTVNGGSGATGRIKSYDEMGAFVDSIVVTLDMRGIYYREQDGHVYIKDLASDWFRLELPGGTITPLETDIFSEGQSSPALTPDGLTILERISLGTSVRVLDFETKVEQDVITGLTSPATFQFQVSVATDGRFLYTWDESPAVSAYDFQGRLVTTFPLPMPIPGSVAGFSLSYTNGMLWVIDTGSQLGTWYGFQLSQAAPAPLVNRTSGAPGTSAPTGCTVNDTASCR